MAASPLPHLPTAPLGDAPNVPDLGAPLRPLGRRFGFPLGDRRRSGHPGSTLTPTPLLREWARRHAARQAAAARQVAPTRPLARPAPRLAEAVRAVRDAPIVEARRAEARDQLSQRAAATRALRPVETPQQAAPTTPRRTPPRGPAPTPAPSRRGRGQLLSDPVAPLFNRGKRIVAAVPVMPRYGPPTATPTAPTLPTMERPMERRGPGRRRPPDQPAPRPGVDMAADTPDAMGREMRRSAAEPDDHRPLWFRAKMDAIARQIAGRERGMIQSVINRRARKRQADEMERARRERFDRSVRGVIAAKHDLEDTKEHPPKGNPQ